MDDTEGRSVKSPWFIPTDAFRGCISTKGFKQNKLSDRYFGNVIPINDPFEVLPSYRTDNTATWLTDC